MPIYEYTCRQCGSRFEQLVRSERDERSLSCPECGAKKPTRELSVIATPRAAGPSSRASGPCGSCGDPNGACPFA